MSELTQKMAIPKIVKGANLIGLSLSSSEVNELQCGKHISLGDRSLSEIGEVFILASALAAVNAGKARKTITFGDLPKFTTDSGVASGVPIYCWESQSSKKLCLYLTLIDSKPAIRICSHDIVTNAIATAPQTKGK